MYYKQLNGFVIEPRTRIDDNLLHRRSATIAEREDELKQQIKNKNVFFGAGEMDALNARMDEFEADICSVIDEKFDRLMEKCKLDDNHDSDYDSDSDDSGSSGSEDTDTESETESEPEQESSDDESDDDEIETKAMKRKKYLKNYHQQYYLKNKAKQME